MTILELNNKLTELLTNNPKIADYRILIDVEARRFNVHMVQLDRVYLENSEVFESMECNWLTFVPSYDLSEL